MLAGRMLSRDPPHSESKGIVMDTLEATIPRPYRHGDVPNAMRAAVRDILEKDGSHDAGLRETARRVGVSATAAYRHFSSKEDLFASVAAQGFRELSAAMKAGADPLVGLGLGLAYVEFALKQPGLFRLMFGPLLTVRAKYPALREAAGETFDLLQSVVAAVDDPAYEQNAAAMAAWGLMHGLSSLFIDGVVPEANVHAMAERILARGGSPRPEPLPAS
jgi:AcrR family transcriptional regulator